MLITHALSVNPRSSCPSFSRFKFIQFPLSLSVFMLSWTLTHTLAQISLSRRIFIVFISTNHTVAWPLNSGGGEVTNWPSGPLHLAGNRRSSLFLVTSTHANLPKSNHFDVRSEWWTAQSGDPLLFFCTLVLHAFESVAPDTVQNPQWGCRTRFLQKLTLYFWSLYLTRFVTNT